MMSNKGEFPEKSHHSFSKGTVATKKYSTLPTVNDLYDNKELQPSQDSKDIQGSSFKTKKELNKKISFFEGSITDLECDAIVNAANHMLIAAGGVDGAIHRAAGPQLQRECDTLNGCPTGEAKITKGYKLPAKAVIHTVGPQKEIPAQLESCYVNSLKLAVKESLRSIAFPCISTGVYGYPNDKAAEIALSTVRTFLEAHSEHIDRVVFCLFLDKDKKIYRKLLSSYFPG